MLLPIDLDEYFIDEEGIAESSVLSLQSSSVDSAEFDTPQADGLSGNSYAALGQEVFDIPVA
jgi:hypothetical protein